MSRWLSIPVSLLLLLLNATVCTAQPSPGSSFGRLDSSLRALIDAHGKVTDSLHERITTSLRDSVTTAALSASVVHDSLLRSLNPYVEEQRRTFDPSHITLKYDWMQRASRSAGTCKSKPVATSSIAISERLAQRVDSVISDLCGHLRLSKNDSTVRDTGTVTFTRGASAALLMSGPIVVLHTSTSASDSTCDIKEIPQRDYTDLSISRVSANKVLKHLSDFCRVASTTSNLDSLTLSVFADSIVHLMKQSDTQIQSRTVQLYELRRVALARELRIEILTLCTKGKRQHIQACDPPIVSEDPKRSVSLLMTFDNTDSWGVASVSNLTRTSRIYLSARAARRVSGAVWEVGLGPRVSGTGTLAELSGLGAMVFAGNQQSTWHVGILATPFQRGPFTMGASVSTRAASLLFGFR